MAPAVHGAHQRDMRAVEQKVGFRVSAIGILRLNFCEPEITSALLDLTACKAADGTCKVRL